MSGFFRGCLVATIALTCGSWFGLGKPDAEQTRTLVNQARDAVPTKVSALTGDAGIPARPTASSEAPSDFGPLPQHTHPDLVPAMTPWPSLNPDVSVQRAWMVAEGPQRKPGDNRRLVTLTFDDGPFLETTPAVLRLLAQNHVHGTFFVVGQYLEGEDKRTRVTRELLRKISAAGHLIGNHTQDHRLLTSISHTQVLDQIDRSAAAIQRATGKMPILFRPPFGELDDFGREAARERRLDMILWNVEAQDMERTDSHQMFRELSQQLEYKEGGIVLLHDIRWSSVATLRELLTWLRERRYDPANPSRPGYEIVDLPTYLRAVAASPQPYSDREALERARKESRRSRRSKVTSDSDGES